MKFKSKFQLFMWLAACISLLVLCACRITYGITENALFYSLTVTAVTFFYHFAVRLFLGEWLLMKLIPKKINYNRKWFAQKKYEARIYKVLKVKSWKTNMPTYAPDEFSPEKNSWEEIVIATCRSEIVHECNVAASFVPLLFSLAVGDLPIFMVTSLGAACFDLVFVIMQRFNRPRLMRMIGKRKKV